jgi:hypothetical protein
MPPVSDEARWLACSRSPAYFLDHYGYVYDAPAAGWTRFRLWPAPVQALAQLAGHHLPVVLKARQLGMSWLTVGFGLWQMPFRPAATVLLFSQRDDEAVQLLNSRLRGMYDRLPPLFRARAVVRDNAHEFRLSNGSAALAFPTTGGRSYTAWTKGAGVRRQGGGDRRQTSTCDRFPSSVHRRRKRSGAPAAGRASRGSAIKNCRGFTRICTDYRVGSARIRANTGALLNACLARSTHGRHSAGNVLTTRSKTCSACVIASLAVLWSGQNSRS